MSSSRSIGRAVAAVIVALMVAAGASACGGQDKSGTAVAFVGRNTDGTIPSAATMDQARQVVRKRAAGSGLPKTTVDVDADMLTITVSGDDGTTARLLGETGRVLIRPVLSTKNFQPGPGKTMPGKEIRQSADPATQTAALAGIDCARPDPLRGADDATLPLVTCANTGDAVYLLGPAAVDGREIADAKGAMDTRTARYGVTVTFTGLGTDQFARFTTANVGKQFAFAVDSQVVSAPLVQAPTVTGETQIVGNFTKDAADSLAAALCSGALPAIFTPQG
ncbi:hypothetical protein D7D52_20455 [Nocardia yunnanensis]|uniref:SecDF P1 head subdomain domain-containing protein n=1 Tax=Nocardia yunnanensis TaxID=2382165 RepID=A0A386ZDT2_9NOCA|nr:hypothetical protein [Nocardia yunnanensis]AYF75821.1 hypothetical protein D7D52_20455 [Nocardia yunnanensis]